MPYYVYILRCADASYYTGSTGGLGRRLTEHQRGVEASAYTFRRRPIDLVWAEEVQTHNEALLHERQIKGWSRSKTEALIRGDYQLIHEIVRSERRKRECKKRKASP